MGSFPFARRYLGNRCFFLFLALLRCFSSGGSPCITMDSLCSDGGSLRRVAPFRYPRITGYLLLTVAFRSLSRLSSALSAKASTLCSLSLDLKCAGSHTPAFGVASPTGRFLSFALSPMKLKIFLFTLDVFSSVCSFQGAIYRNPKGYYLKVFLQSPALPYRLQYSTIGRLWLNRRVRHGNGCFP